MAQSVARKGAAIVRVSTLLDELTRRSRSPTEHEIHMLLQAEAEHALMALLKALGDMDEQPLRQAILELTNPYGNS